MGLDKDDIKALISILQKGLQDDDDGEEEVSEEPQKSTSHKPTSSKKNTKKKSTKNLFDSMAESRMHKDDVEIDKKLNKLPPTQRSRNYKPASVKCRVCGKDEKVNPSLIESVDRYKCNKCSTSAG